MPWLIFIACFGLGYSLGPFRVIISADAPVPLGCPKNTTLVLGFHSWTIPPECAYYYLGHSYNAETGSYSENPGIVIILDQPQWDIVLIPPHLPSIYEWSNYDQIYWEIFPRKEDWFCLDDIPFNWLWPIEACISDLVAQLKARVRNHYTQYQHPVHIFTSSRGELYLRQALIHAPKLMPYIAKSKARSFNYQSELNQAAAEYQQNRIMCYSDWLQCQSKNTSCQTERHSCLKKARRQKKRHQLYAELGQALRW